MFLSGGTFSGALEQRENSPVVLANYTGTTITDQAGSGKTVLGQAGRQQREVAADTLTGYAATHAAHLHHERVGGAARTVGRRRSRRL